MTDLLFNEKDVMKPWIVGNIVGKESLVHDYSNSTSVFMYGLPSAMLACADGQDASYIAAYSIFSGLADGVGVALDAYTMLNASEESYKDVFETYGDMAGAFNAGDERVSTCLTNVLASPHMGIRLLTQNYHLVNGEVVWDEELWTDKTYTMEELNDGVNMQGSKIDIVLAALTSPVGRDKYLEMIRDNETYEELGTKERIDLRLGLLFRGIDTDVDLNSWVTFYPHFSGLVFLEKEGGKIEESEDPQLQLNKDLPIPKAAQSELIEKASKVSEKVGF